MTECRFSDAVLSEADPAELAGSTDTELARHIAECRSCRAAAERILAANRSLHEVLGRAPALDVDALLARADLRPVDGSRTDEGSPRPAVNPGAPPRPWMRWAALAAAASIAALLLARQVDRPPSVGTPVRAIVSHPTYEVPASWNLAVLPTDNPDITVLWFF